MAWQTKQLTRDEACCLLMIDLDSNKEDFQEAEVIFVRENDSDVDVSSDFFFEIPNDRKFQGKDRTAPGISVKSVPVCSDNGQANG